VRFFWGFFAVAAAWGWQGGVTIQNETHFSQVMNANRTYRVFLPASYAAPQKRYPVLYWFHGYESSAEVDAYSKAISDYLGAHDLIVVDSGPLDTTGEFPLYFLELVDRVDHSLRTIADRDHRGVAGYSAGGFLAFYAAGKFPDLVSSASSFMGPTEYSAGPKGFDAEYNATDAFANLDGVRTRLVTGSRDFIRFYHGGLNAVWSFVLPGHETEDFDAEHSAPGVAKTLDFHMHAFANPLAKPAMFTHSDVYPNFAVWGWEVASDRRQPGFTVLENVSATGFRSAVREWLPSGAAIPEVKLSVASAKLYAPGSTHTVSYVHLPDGQVRHAQQKADAQGRLNFELGGDPHEVGIGSDAIIAATGYDVADGAWLTAGKPVKLRIRFLNKGAVRSAPAPVQWMSPDAGVKFAATSSQLFSLMPGETVPLPVTVTVPAGRAMLRIIAVKGTTRMPVDVPVFPEAAPTSNFQIADGRTVTVYQHGTEKTAAPFGEGNGDGHAAPGEAFAVLLPDGDALRAAEVLTSDSCVDTSVRASDSWTDYDHTGASAKYSLPAIRKDCPPGHIVHMLARVVIPHAPDHEVRYAAIEFPVWYRRGEEPK
jgi:pimeloyl-ACP methyl ester carboxylesterase